MTKRYTITVQLVTLLLVVALSGCLMVREGNSPSISQWPLQQSSTETKTISLDATGRIVSDGNEHPVNEIYLEKFRHQTIKAYNDSGLFAEAALNKENSDFKAEVTIIEKGSGTGAFISGFISGFTFTMIPAYASGDLIIKTTFKDEEKNLLQVIEKKESFSFWIQLFLLFAMPFKDGPETVIEKIHYDLNRLVIKEAHTKGIF